MKNHNNIESSPQDNSDTLYFDPDKLKNYYNYTADNLQYYFQDHTKDNIDLLSQTDNQQLLNVYQNLIEEYPCLSNICLSDNTKARFRCTTSPKDGPYYTSEIDFNFSHPESYVKSSETSDNEPFKSENTLKMLALRLGASPRDVMRNQNLVTTFILAHELGHAYDFQMNYLIPELDREDNVINALSIAVAKNKSRRRREKDERENSGKSKNGLIGSIKNFLTRLDEFGIGKKGAQRMEVLRSRSYREMPGETYADDFAIEYIMEHRDDFFEDINSNNLDDPSKIKTYIGESMPIGDRLDFLGMDRGKAMKFTKINIEDETFSDKNFSGTLARSVRMNEPIQLYEDNGPDLPKQIISSPAVKNVFIDPYVEDNKVKNHILVHMTNKKDENILYLAEFTDEKN
ncbi:hypothetical protein IJH74_02440 [Candidatus Saccharibacteria bacterium]|nr:hypothetical protein [Candidatus Saccharibacteria bacterium]